MMLFEKGSLGTSWPIVMRGLPNPNTKYGYSYLKMSSWNVPDSRVPDMLGMMWTNESKMGQPGNHTNV
jgi:hypothetical protein